MKVSTRFAAIGAALLVGGATLEAEANHIGAIYIASTWADESIHFLDANFVSIGSFNTGAGNPNGVAWGGGYIWSGHFTNQSVIAYDHNGVQQFTWSHGLLSGLQGLEYIHTSAQIAAASGADIHFFTAGGTHLNSYAAAESGTIEGITYADITFEGITGILFQLGTDAIYATDASNGNVLYTLTNPAIGDPFGGTGIGYNHSTDVLAVAGANGNWYEIDPYTGIVLNSGNNGLTMYGLKHIPTPGALALLGVAGLFGVPRRRR